MKEKEITNIDDIPESAIEELSDNRGGDDDVEQSADLLQQNISEQELASVG